ncbi:MAG TPA: hypothetical protein VG826_06580 [Pirellulales bacterium]|nr:hypothetical protein [Pirellulales bacterium]
MKPILFAADAFLIIKVVGGIIVALIYVVNHFLAAAAKQQRRQMRPEARPDPRAPRAGGRPDVQDEVAEFLKRASERRGTKPAEGRPTQERIDPRIQEMRAAAQKRQAAARPPAMAEIVEAREVRSLESRAMEPLPSARRPVQTHLDTRELADRGGHLTHVDRTEAAFQAHMQSLDHQVGRINESAAPSASDDAGPQTIGPPPNEVFAALLADPQSLRQAIILNEIIERPVERW